MNPDNEPIIEKKSNIKGSYEVSNYKDNLNISNDVYFVKDGLKGDGTNPSNTVSTIREAISKLENKSGTIVICGEYTIDTSTVLPEYNDITITSLYKNINYALVNDAQIRLDSGLRFNGKTTVENIHLVATSDSTYIVCAGNKTVFGDGINSETYINRGTRLYPTIIGGYNNPTTVNDKDTELTIKSGKWENVIGGNRCTYNKENKEKYKILADFNNNINIKIEGGAFYGSVIAGNMGNMTGNINMQIDNGEFYCTIYAIPASTTCLEENSTMNGNIKISINNGKFCGEIDAKQHYNYILKDNGVEDIEKNRQYIIQFINKDEADNSERSYQLNLNGGDFKRVNTIRGLTDGKAEINVSEDIDLEQNIDSQIDFVNPLNRTADPSIIYLDGWYYQSYSQTFDGKPAIAVKKATNIGDIDNATPVYIWKYTEENSNVDTIWGPQLYILENNLYVYGILRESNESGEIVGTPIILKAEDAKNPQGKYQYLGQMNYGYKDENNNVIKTEIRNDKIGNVNITDNIYTWLSSRFFEYNNKLYLVCGGVTKDNQEAIKKGELLDVDTGKYFDHAQVMLLVQMLDPCTINIGDIKTLDEDGNIKVNVPVIMEATRDWEKQPNGDKISSVIEGAFPTFYNNELYLLYSTGSTYGNTYCTGLLKFLGSNQNERNDGLTNPENWVKYENPIHQSNTEEDIISVGAMILVQSPDGKEVFAIYHGKPYANTGWTRRYVFAQKAVFVDDEVNLYSTMRGEKLKQENAKVKTLKFLKADNTTTDMPESINSVYTVKANTLPLSKRISEFVEKEDKKLIDIQISQKPFKLEYIQNTEKLDITGGKVTLFYDDNSTEVINITEEMVYGFDNSKVGSIQLTIKYEGFIDVFDVKIIEKVDTDNNISDNTTTDSNTSGNNTIDTNTSGNEVIDSNISSNDIINKPGNFAENNLVDSYKNITDNISQDKTTSKVVLPNTGTKNIIALVIILLIILIICMSYNLKKYKDI